MFSASIAYFLLPYAPICTKYSHLRESVSSVTSIKNKSYWNYNNLNPKDPVALGLFTQNDLVKAIEKAERRIKREKKEKEKAKKASESSINE